MRKLALSDVRVEPLSSRDLSVPEAAKLVVKFTKETPTLDPEQKTCIYLVSQSLEESIQAVEEGYAKQMRETRLYFKSLNRAGKALKSAHGQAPGSSSSATGSSTSAEVPAATVAEELLKSPERNLDPCSR